MTLKKVAFRNFIYFLFSLVRNVVKFCLRPTWGSRRSTQKCFFRIFFFSVLKPFIEAFLTLDSIPKGIIRYYLNRTDRLLHHKEIMIQI